MDMYKKIFIDITHISDGIAGLSEDEYLKKIHQILDFHDISRVFLEYLVEDIKAQLCEPEKANIFENHYSSCANYVFNEFKKCPEIINLLSPTFFLEPCKGFQVLFSDKTGEFQLKNNFPNNHRPLISKKYTIEDVLEFELFIKHKSKLSNSRLTNNISKDGFLFTSLGNAPLQPIKTKNKYSVRLVLNDMNTASIEIPCDSSEEAYKLVSTFAVFEKKMKTQNPLEKK